SGPWSRLKGLATKPYRRSAMTTAVHHLKGHDPEFAAEAEACTRARLLPRRSSIIVARSLTRQRTRGSNHETNGDCRRASRVVCTPGAGAKSVAGHAHPGARGGQ